MLTEEIRKEIESKISEFPPCKFDCESGGLGGYACDANTFACAEGASAYFAILLAEIDRLAAMKLDERKW